MSEENKKLFEKYRFTKEQINVFEAVRKVVPKDELSSERLIMCVCSKKTTEKTIKVAKGYAKLIKDYSMDSMTIESFPKLYKENEYFKVMMDSEFFFFPTHVQTKEGLGICYMDYGNWVPAKTKEDRKICIRVFIKLFEVFVLSNPSFVTEGVLFLCTLDDFGIANFDFQLEKVVASLLQTFPVRMKKMVITDTPWFFRLLWNLIKPFYSAKMKKRFVIIKGKDKIFDYVKKEDTIKHFGGSVDFGYKAFLKDVCNIDVKSIEKVEKKKMSKEEVIKKIEEIKEKEGIKDSK